MSGESFGIIDPQNTPTFPIAEAPDPATFSFDDWLSGVTRPVETVPIIAKGHLNEELKNLERRIAVAERIPAAERGITDVDDPFSLREEWTRVAQEMIDSELPFKVRALTSDEFEEAKAAARAAKATETEHVLYIVSLASVAPKVSVGQLMRLREAAGDAGIAQLYATIMKLSNNSIRPTAPFSQKPSGGRVR